MNQPTIIEGSIWRHKWNFSITVAILEIVNKDQVRIEDHYNGDKETVILRDFLLFYYEPDL